MLEDGIYWTSKFQQRIVKRLRRLNGMWDPDEQRWYVSFDQAEMLAKLLGDSKV